MFGKIKLYLDNLSNPLLYYIDKNENSFFRNFCLFSHRANSYNRVIPVKEAGKIIEFRILLGKKLKIYNIIIIILLYLLYIHKMYNIYGLLICEFIAVILIFSGKIYASNIFKNKLLNTFGPYSVTEFNPLISKEKKKNHRRTYIGKFILLFFLIVVFEGFSYLLKNLISYSVNLTPPNYIQAEILANIHNAIYPKSGIIYEFRAFRYYSNGDFNAALENYIKMFELSGKTFHKQDYIRFANLLFLVKKSGGSRNAVDLYNEIMNKKDLNISQQTKLLWIKSIFSIANNISEFVYNDYDDLLLSLKENDSNKFYILSDKAYIQYLKHDYNGALITYNYLIQMAIQNSQYSKELQRLYAERGYTKQHLGDIKGAESDFSETKMNIDELKKLQPLLIEPKFISYKL